MLNKLQLLSASRGNVTAIVCTTQSRSCSHDFKEIKNTDPVFLRRGTGGRSSFNGNVVTVFGATGFLGRHICNQLGKRGTQLIIPYRCDPDEYTLKQLKLFGDLGQVLFQPFDLRDPLSIRKAIKYSNVVINLIGTYYETPNFKLYDVNVKGATEIAKACKEMNVERLIHFSSLNLTENPKKYYLKKSQFLPTKLKGEEAVREIFPDATIFRPSICYGFMDSFLWALCDFRRLTGNSVPLYKKGEETIRQPVYAPDVALGVVNAINDHDTIGKIYQIVGPERFYLKDIVTFCNQICQRHIVKDKFIHDVMFDIRYPMRIIFVTHIFGYFWSVPRYNLCFEQIERESVTDIVDINLPTLEDLGVQLAKMEDRVPHLILKTFKSESDKDRGYENYYAADSLSAKAITGYA